MPTLRNLALSVELVSIVGITGTPGQVVTVSGIDENKTVTCNDAAVNISGIRNTVNITGHCVKITVSGVENVITVADRLRAAVRATEINHVGSPARAAIKCEILAYATNRHCATGFQFFGNINGLPKHS